MKTKNSESNKVTSVSKCSLDAQGAISAKAPQSTGVYGQVHITLHCFLFFLLWRIKLVMIHLLHFSATITVNLLEVLITFKGQFLAICPGKGGIEARSGLNALQQEWA